jgi:acyl-CoA thioesterase
MSEKEPTAIIDQMHHNDPFSKWLDIVRVGEGVGECILSMRIRDEMLNGFAIAHGGVLFSLADSALAFAANTQGHQHVSVETTISYFKPAKAGDTITAVAKRIFSSKRLAHYEVSVLREEEQLALLKGIVYNTQKDW